MGVDMEREGGMVPGDIVATPWVATTEIQRAEVNAKVGYVLPGQQGRSWGSQWTASTHRHFRIEELARLDLVPLAMARAIPTN